MNRKVLLLVHAVPVGCYAAAAGINASSGSYAAAMVCLGAGVCAALYAVIVNWKPQ